jgi:hypothetical protein
MAEIDLAFIARQLERLVNDMTRLKEDMVGVMPGWAGWTPRRTAW